MSNLPAARYSIWQAVSAALALGQRAIEEARAIAREPGPKGDPGDLGAKGERGDAGPAGKLPIVRQWVDRVYYQSDVVSHAGSTFQALRDTAREPPHDDWQCIAIAGRNGNDGRSLLIRGTFDPSCEDYRELNIVVLNGASFSARRDSPGPCPGDGWQLIAAQGKRGNQGERGERGAKGDRGEAGSPVVALSINNEAVLTLTNGDGSTVELDLYPLLSRLN